MKKKLCKTSIKPSKMDHPVILGHDEFTPQVLTCPECGEPYMHVHKTEVINQLGDSKNEMETIVEGTNSEARIIYNEIWGWEYSTLLYCSCEYCHGDNEEYYPLFILAIRYSSGNLFMEWLKDG